MSLLQMSVAGGVMILAVIVIRAMAINLLPKKTFGVLWGIAAVRLLIPFSVPSAFSVYSLLGGHASAIDAVKSPRATQVLPIGTKEQMTTMPGSISNAISIWTVIWAAGMFVCVMLFAVSYWKCRQEFRTSLPVDNDFTRNWLIAHQQRRVISIRQSSRFSAPLTYGIFQPVILMPISTKWENTKTLQYVLAHEYVHIRRLDSIRKLVLIAVLCVHWFNPLVWAMYILANRDIELSCDEAVVRLFGESTKAAYARALISMEETRSGLIPLGNNFSKNAIEERITAIMKIKKTTIFSFVLAGFIVAGTATAFATSVNTQQDDKTTDIDGNDVRTAVTVQSDDINMQRVEMEVLQENRESVNIDIATQGDLDRDRQWCDYLGQETEKNFMGKEGIKSADATVTYDKETGQCSIELLLETSGEVGGEKIELYKSILSKSYAKATLIVDGEVR
ncbi:MAG: M56 family metallopeptidase [Acetatifactor sp.]|nr:M56 family metallopeptidase [Acetatifactor sp.]